MKGWRSSGNGQGRGEENHPQISRMTQIFRKERRRADRSGRTHGPRHGAGAVGRPVRRAFALWGKGCIFADEN